MTRVDEILRRVVGPDVLDIGCTGHQVQPGDRSWLHGRLREKYRVTGLDVSRPNIEQLRSLGFDDLHVQSAEEFELHRLYDTVVAGEVIEHLSNPGRFLDRSRTHLRPQGQIVLSTPYPFSIMYGLYASNHFPRTCENREHTCWVCPSTLRELSARARLEIVEWALVNDYDPRIRSRKYRMYWALSNTAGKLLPDRLIKTTLIAVLKRDAN
ncbi:MAG TPA: methyltransferase domain-containing protein [Bryobacteraceae bacterium]|nr:methyltransferase domain-containing protein [Bryobacteraceae bacterium]